jgi:uncharacterized protein YegL
MSDQSSEDDKPLILAFYVVVDVSLSMSGANMVAANQILPEVYDHVAHSPTLSDVVRLGAIDFSDDARVLVHLSDLRDIDPIPQFSVRGGTSYSAAFRLLRQEIEKDLAQLKGDGYKVYRPAVFFITDGEPTDDMAELQQEFDHLTDKGFKGRPNLIPFGVGDATKSNLDPWIYPKAADSGKPMRSFVPKGGVSAPEAIRQITEVLISSIVASAQSVQQGGVQGGFIPPDTDDLDDWI